MNKKFDFKIIYNEQTPKVVSDIDINKFDNTCFLIDSFLEYVKTIPNCAGLAANQVSYKTESRAPIVLPIVKRLERRFFAINIGLCAWKIFVNPKIIEYIGEPEMKYEGCKTWINRTIYANRYPKVKVSYFDYIDGNHAEATLSNFDAQVFQHELNHLNGIEEKFWHEHLFEKEKRGRNEPCICGSGEKYKNCCLNPVIINI
jgi:peptide deformylase